MDDATLNTLKSWIGRSITLHSDLPVFGAQALAGAIDHTEAPGPGDKLPLPWHWLYFLDPTRRDRADSCRRCPSRAGCGQQER